ncbi:MAG: hypothetical protein LCH91_00460 [Bacteroidetes bacterium]|nr:hypothetical protein [Bacteroidota bacterium]
MIQSPKFEVNLGGIDLNEKQAQELEKALQQTTLQFLAKLDNGFNDGLLAYKPNPENPEDTGLPPFVLPKRPKWWFGYILWKQPKPGQIVQLDRLKASFPDFAVRGAFEKPQLLR